MKLTKEELRDFKSRMEDMVATSDIELQVKLAQYWLDKIKVRGRYCLCDRNT